MFDIYPVFLQLILYFLSGVVVLLMLAVIIMTISLPGFICGYIVGKGYNLNGN